MTQYPSNYNDPTTLTFDAVIERQAVQDTVSSTGLSSLTQTTDPIGDMIKAIGMLEVEIENFKRTLLLPNTLVVDVATTASLNNGSVLYQNGTNGVDAQLFLDEDLAAIDGVNPYVGMRILVKDELTPSLRKAYNGIYTVTSLGVGSYALTRTTDADSSDELKSGTTVVVRQGNTNGKRMFICVNEGVTDLGITPMIFTELYSKSQLPFGDENNILFANAATTAALPSTAAIIYNNGLGGVGASLSRGENGALGNIDGISLNTGDKILVKNQALSAQNGLYVIQNLGSGGSPYVLVRDTSADEPNEYASGLSVKVLSGSTNGGQWYKNTNTSSVTMGTTGITWSLFTSVDNTRPFPDNIQFPIDERTYFVNLYGSKLKQLQKEALDLSLRVKKMQVYLSGYTNVVGDQSPTDNIYPSSQNRGW